MTGRSMDEDAVTFTIKGQELVNMRNWRDGHECAEPGQYDLNIYPWTTYEFTPSGLGTCVCVRCSRCGKKQEITDFSNW